MNKFEKKKNAKEAKRLHMIRMHAIRKEKRDEALAAIQKDAEKEEALVIIKKEEEEALADIRKEKEEALAAIRREEEEALAAIKKEEEALADTKKEAAAPANAKVCRTVGIQLLIKAASRDVETETVADVVAAETQTEVEELDNDYDAEIERLETIYYDLKRDRLQVNGAKVQLQRKMKRLEQSAEKFIATNEALERLRGQYTEELKKLPELRP